MSTKPIDKTIKELFNEISLDSVRYDGTEEFVFFGKLIASGMYSSVFKVQYPYIPSKIEEMFKDPVLVISTEKHKEKLFHSLSGIKTFVPDYEKLEAEAREEWAEYANEDEEFYWSEYAGEFNIYPFLSYIASEYDLTVFFTEKLSSNVEIEDKKLDFVLDMITEHIPGKEKLSFYQHIDADIVALDTEEILEAYNLNDTEFEEYMKFYELTIRDIKKASKVLSAEVEKDIYVTVDIHEKQYLNTSNSIICADPFVFH